MILPPTATTNRRPSSNFIRTWSLLVMGVGLVIIIHSVQRTDISRDQLRGKYDFAKRWSNVDSYCGAALSGEEGASSPAWRQWVEGGGATLLGLQVVIRHGDRSSIHWPTADRPPFSCAFTNDVAVKAVQRFSRFEVIGSQGKATADYLFPKAEPNNKAGAACFPGQLTQKGLLQLMATGRYLRSRYPMMGWEKLTPNQIYFRSTYYPRTVQSGGALLLGLLPEDESPITVHTREDNTLEPLFGVGLHGVSREHSKDPLHVPDRGFCQRSVELAAMQEGSYRSPSGVDVEIGRLYPSIPAVADLPVTDQTDPLMACTCNDVSLPCDPAAMSCPSSQTVLLAKEDSDRQFCLRYVGSKGGKEATELAMYPILKEIYDRFAELVEGKTYAVKLTLLSSHDTVIAPLAAALNGYDCRWPPYASRVVFELWRHSGRADGWVPQHYVRILYNGKTISSEMEHCLAGREEAEEEEEEAPAPGLISVECFRGYIERLLGTFQSIEDACNPDKQK